MKYNLYIKIFLVVVFVHYVIMNVSLFKKDSVRNIQTRVSFKIQSINKYEKDPSQSNIAQRKSLKKKKKVKKNEKNKVKKQRSNKQDSAPPSRVSEFDQFFIVEPEFPYLSRVYGESGKVVIRIKTDGKDILNREVEKSSGFTRLDQAALKAIDNASLKKMNELLPDTLIASIEFQILDD